ncbi:MAG TPA: hypothetical protein VFR12_13590, partial [Pyrinomonadaceae bacterium]|nr:hypothetical protein [Pyrinomonadaceae bacterium]
MKREIRELHVVVFNLGYCREGYFHNLTIGTFDLYARSGESLSGFHTAHCAADAPAVDRDNLNIVFAIQWLKSGQGFGYLHLQRPPTVESSRN